MHNLPSALVIDPQPKFDISPWLDMQFMEPPGVTGIQLLNFMFFVAFSTAISNAGGRNGF